MKRVGYFMAAFGIGAIAGVSPFIAMQILPSLLNPDTSMTSGNWTAICIWGTLIGLITAVIFGKQLDKKDPMEIFVYALGIPAILLATITNMSTQMGAKAQINTIQERANADMSDVPINIIGRPSPVTTDKKIKTGAFGIFSFSEAFADSIPRATPVSGNQPQSTTGPSVRPDTVYLVTIGNYEDSLSAIKDLAAFSRMKIKTDNYIAGKSLEVLKFPADQGKIKYCIKYAQFNKKEDAIKAFRLLRVNDPSFDVQIYQF